MKMKEKYTKLFAYTKKCLYLCISFREERQFEKSSGSEINFHNSHKKFG